MQGYCNQLEKHELTPIAWEAALSEYGCLLSLHLHRHWLERTPRQILQGYPDNSRAVGTVSEGKMGVMVLCQFRCLRLLGCLLPILAG